MKRIFPLLVLFAICIQVNAQIVLDDFTTGPLVQTNLSAQGSITYNQTGNKIFNKKRSTIVKIGENPENQLFQTKISAGKLTASLGAGIIGAIELRYGGNRLDELNLDLSTYKTLNIEYQTKSNFGRVYVSMFSNGPNRAFWRGGGNTNEVYQGSISLNGSNRPFVLKIPLNQFISAQDNASVENKFTIKNVDFLKIQFICQGQQGLNFSVSKIWIE
tara:strand:- start:180888 stop:181538 length:651 start_codon:yes stop_codon:yes gene_type:complete